VRATDRLYTAAQLAVHQEISLREIRLLRASRKLRPAGTDDHGRPVYRLDDVYRAARALTRR
jgi:hypothetical protein